MADEEREIEIEEIVKRVDGREHRAIKGVSKVLMLVMMISGEVFILIMCSW